MRDYLAKYPRGLAVVVCAMLAILVFTLGLSIQVRNNWIAVDDDLQVTAKRLTAMRDEAVQLVAALNRDRKPACSESLLQDLRRIVVSTRYVAVIGVLDTDGRWMCTTVMDALQRGDAGGPPDYVTQSKSGQPSKTYYQRAIPGLDDGTTTVLLEEGRFGLALYPFAVMDLTDGLTAAVRIVTPDGLSSMAAIGIGVSSGIEQALAHPDFQQAHFTFDWTHQAFLQSLPIEGTRYVAQGGVPLHAFLSRYAGALLAWALISVLVAILAYAAALAQFRRLSSLDSRIGGLLRAENLVCMYQPILDLRTRKVVGCEVLMRLMVDGRMVFPDQLIPVIQSKGLTWELDQLVVRCALRELALGLPDVRSFKVAFNFFPSSVSAGGIPGLLSEFRGAGTLPGLLINVEVLEQEYSAQLASSVAELRKTNVLISVDDFGTGYSNLGSVKALAPDFLKIDRSFVRDMEEASVRSSLIPEVVGIGRAVGAAIVAEGIENDSQCARLHAMGVEFGQGYLFSKPVRLAEFSEYFRANAAEPLAPAAA